MPAIAGIVSERKAPGNHFFEDFLALRWDFLALWLVALCFLVAFAGAGAAWVAGATGATGVVACAIAPKLTKPATNAARSLFIVQDSSEI